jgi:redox-sensitive bicupin YhaK (pirin superfamily)
MPAASVPDLLVLPRIPRPDPALTVFRPVRQVITAPSMLEGAGFPVRRPFPGPWGNIADPFLLLDQIGAIEYAPGEAKGAPWHPHRGFETVTYIIDGALRHTDSNGGGGVITDGATQWMTAGAGILHDELPTDELVRTGGLFHGIQLWVNLPATLKFAPPRYQDIRPDRLALLTSDDGGTLVRVIAGELAGHRGPGVTYTPISYAHATLTAGARLSLPWVPEYNALVYVLAGSGTVGFDDQPIREGQLAVLGPGDGLTLAADPHGDSRAPNLDVLLIGGRPIGEPVVSYGPFVMNTREEIMQAILDYQAGRMGVIPARHLSPQMGEPR